MSRELKKGLFMGHNADDFPLDQILDFMATRGVSYPMVDECDYCDSEYIEYYREEEVFYSKQDGFVLIEDDEEPEDADDPEKGKWVDFGIYRCPKCYKWFTYIE